MRRPSTWQTMLRHPSLLLWAMFICLVPFYIVRSGLPQPGDALIILLLPAALSGWSGRLDRRSRLTFRALMWFTAWVTLVDLAYAIILNSWGADATFPLFYIYNAALLLTALALHDQFGEVFLKITINAVFFTVLAQVPISFIHHGSQYRASVFFDNPNQLGYYSLLTACVIALLSKPTKFGVLKTSIGLMACGYLAMLSASRSAATSIMLLVALQLISNPRVIATACIAVFAVILAGGTESSSFQELSDRFSDARDSNLTFFEQRGYDRIYNNPEYVITGAGEGNRERFETTTKIFHAEIHSSAGTILFSYGIVGVVLFGVFLRRLMRGAPIRTALVLAPPLMYTVAHQGMRFTMLWVLLALYLAVIRTQPQSTAAAPAASPTPTPTPAPAPA